MDVATLQAFLVQAIPYNRLLNIQVKSVEPEQVEVVLPASPDHLNHVGTTHAGAQFSLGEATSGAMVVSAFSDALANGVIPLATESTIRYRKPAQGELHGTASLSSEEQTRLREIVARNQRAQFSISVQLKNSDGVTTTELDVTWMLLPPRKPV
ncbi:MAG TPA: YiiD C-terminal domain-containing protein [Ktedonobacterales bacterium]|jgi:uncharacterized protein (TIGR00369 family)